MLMQLMSLDGVLFLLRWFHIFFGVIWIGHLYYFNFVQGAFFNETDATTKSNAIQKLVPRALWWFRYGALWTLITGLTIIGIRGHQMGAEFMSSAYGLNISTGMLMGILMAYNVWMIIWPAQQVVIKSATQAASGGQAIPEAAARGARAALASRTNVLFSIPMLFFMAAARHLSGYQVTNSGLYWILAGILIVAIQFNAIKGKMGPITTIKGVITSGFVLTAIFVAIISLTQG